MSLIYGTKTVLRRFEDRMSDADIARLYDWSTDSELLRLSGGTVTDLSPGEFAEHVRGERLYGPTNRRMFLVLARDTLELIGRMGIFAIDWNQRQAEMGIVIGERAYQNRGYGRDAVHTLLGHLYSSSSLDKIYLYTFADNIRAQRSFAAAGFRVTEKAPRFTPDIGEFDSVKMELVRAEFVGRGENDLAKAKDSLSLP